MRRVAELRRAWQGRIQWMRELLERGDLAELADELYAAERITAGGLVPAPTSQLSLGVTIYIGRFCRHCRRLRAAYWEPLRVLSSDVLCWEPCDCGSFFVDELHLCGASRAPYGPCTSTIPCPGHPDGVSPGPRAPSPR